MAKLLILKGPKVHLSNVFARESFRHHSYLSVAVGLISGLGAKGYELALQAADDYLSRR